MLSYGTNIQSSTTEALKKLEVSQVYHLLKNPSPVLAAQLRQLRIIRDLDLQRFAQLKKQLPYVVCGIFNPAFRKTENFAYAEYFILDIDHISGNKRDIETLQNEIRSDPRVMLLFLSPSEDGLKVLFRLKERCWDAGIYSVFYKSFAWNFAQQYHIEDIIDTRTSDVCRACFISPDPNVYFNPKAETIDLKACLDTEDVSSLLELKKELEHQEIVSQETMPDKPETTNDPDAETMKKIRQQLQGKIKTSSEITVPPELDTIMEGVGKLYEENGIQLLQVKNIQYGKNLKLQLGLKKAELNLFYGKKGFTVVMCPRTGTNNDLCSLCAEMLREYIEKTVG